MTVTLDLDPTLVAEARAQAAREGTTLAHFVGRSVADRLAATRATAPLRPRRSSAEIIAEIDRLGPASEDSENFDRVIRELRAQDAELEARARARLDAIWAGEA